MAIVAGFCNPKLAAYSMEAHHTSNPWTYLEVKRSKIMVCMPINAETESVIIGLSTEREGLRTSKLLYANGAWYQLPRPAIKAYKVGLLHARGDIPCRPNPAVTQLVKNVFFPLS